MKLSHIVTTYGLLISAGILTACQTTDTANSKAESTCIEQTPLPKPTPIIAPSEDVTNEFSQFSGIWSNGKWDNKLCATLVVTSIDAGGNAKAIYSHGAYAGWNIPKPKFFNASGEIEDGKLILKTFGNGANVAYWFSEDSLKGSYTRRGNTVFTTLSKVVPAAGTYVSVPLRDDTAESLLTGSWKGEFTSTSLDGKLRFASPVILTISKDQKAKFHMVKNNRSWISDVTIANDAPVMTIEGKGEHSFILSKNGPDQKLSVMYQSTRDGFHRNNVFLLKRE